MEDWAKRLDRFLEADDRSILQDSGKISVQLAKEFAESEFEKYRLNLKVQHAANLAGFVNSGIYFFKRQAFFGQLEYAAFGDV